MSKRSKKKKNKPVLLPKICGADVELGNFVQGLQATTDTCREASRALLEQVDGVPGDSGLGGYQGGGYYQGGMMSSGGYYQSGTSWYGNQYQPSLPTVSVYNPQDWGRKFLSTNGGCIYIDSNHLEICLPEVRSARDHVAAWHAMLRVTRDALDAANSELPEGQKIQVLVNNSDGLGHSYGGHLDFLVSRQAWNSIFHRKIHQMLFLAAYQASSIIFTGQGKVGSENQAPAVAYQLSQRADFFQCLNGSQTMFSRPIVNSRDESLCGTGRSGGEDLLARLHCIFYDSNLAHGACYLKVGVMQIILAMIEAGCVNSRLCLEDPVAAVIGWSHDVTLTSRAKLISGSKMTALELQFCLLEDAKRFAAQGSLADLVPGCDDILSYWEDTLRKLHERDWAALAPRLDWVLKRHILEHAMSSMPQLNWGSLEIKHLDQVYGNLALDEGLYWAYERSGFVERLVDDDRIDRLTSHPPEDTRAWTRAMLLRRSDGLGVDRVDWDKVKFRTRDGHRTLELYSPLRFTKEECLDMFREHEDLEELLDALGADEEMHTAAPAGAYGSSSGSRPYLGGNDYDTLS